MSQQYSADAQMLTAPVTIVTVAETNGPKTIPLPIPNANGKVVVRGSVVVTTGAGTTGLQLRVRRNILAENVIINVVTTFTVGAAVNTLLPFNFTDQVPDGRSVDYTVSIQAVGAGGNGSIVQGTTIEATVLSG